LRRLPPPPFRKTLRDFVEKEIKPNADAWDEAP
jgi:hypothetical protein